MSQANAFKEQILKCGITQADLAYLCGCTEVSMSRYLNLERKIPLAVFMTICSATEIEPSELYRAYLSARLERMNDKEEQT